MTNTSLVCTVRSTIFERFLVFMVKCHFRLPCESACWVIMIYPLSIFFYRSLAFSQTNQKAPRFELWISILSSVVVWRRSESTIESCRSLRSLRVVGIDFRLELGFFRHMDSFSQTAGGEGLKDIKHEMIKISKSIQSSFWICFNRYWYEANCSVHSVSYYF